LDVKLNGSPTKIQRGPFHQQLVLREDRVAGVARFAVAWTAPNRSDAVMRQAPVLDLVPDETTERFLVHSGLAGGIGVKHAKFTGVSAPERAEHSTDG
jgi:hypothetical protein